MTVEPSHYDKRLEAKVHAVTALLSAHAKACAPPTVYRSRALHFRDRARFAIGRDPEGRLSYALFDGGQMSYIKAFPIASRAINELMPRLIAGLQESELLSHALAAVHFLGTQSGDMLVTLIYGAPLQEGWRVAAEDLKRALGLPALVGRAKGTAVLLDREWVNETLSLSDGRRLVYRQMEGSFSNPSAASEYPAYLPELRPCAPSALHANLSTTCAPRHRDAHVRLTSPYLAGSQCASILSNSCVHPPSMRPAVRGKLQGSRPRCWSSIAATATTQLPLQSTSSGSSQWKSIDGCAALLSTILQPMASPMRAYFVHRRANSVAVSSVA